MLKAPSLISWDLHLLVTKYNCRTYDVNMATLHPLVHSQFSFVPCHTMEYGRDTTAFTEACITSYFF